MFVRTVMAVAALGAAQTVRAQDRSEAAEPQDDAIVVYGRALEQIGEATAGSQGTVGFKDFEARPLGRVGELAENVPGLIATQHSGTGKANQYFLRGFNLDHGTDLGGFVDGVPINMRSHGHGQGYLDLNFLIPELVERIDYAKGPYQADAGDFSAAGTIRFSTVRSLDRPIVEATAGSYGYYRGLAAGSFDAGEGKVTAALDATLSNGPWVLDEDLRKFNGLLQYSSGDSLRLQVNGYHAEWRSTDQVPQRAIESGLIDRYGFIDPDLGGETTRLGLVAEAEAGGIAFNAYAHFYDFRLTSNFTYFLDDPVDGDEFQQLDRRFVFGGSARKAVETGIGTLRLGVEARSDIVDRVGLFHSVDGRRTAATRDDSVDESSIGAFAELQAKLTPRLRLVLGARGDVYGYNVRSDLPVNSGSGSDAIFLPKAALAWQALPGHLELYANYGESFHSNDVRGAAISIDPATGDPAERVPVLVRARGAELGARAEAAGFTASLVGFWLELGSELVFVGDAGSTEPNDATRRFGVEGTLFWRPTPTLAIDAAATYTDARFTGVPRELDRIPGAVEEVVSAGVSWTPVPALTTTLRLRHFGTAPLIEDDSQRSDPTTLVNLGGYYTVGSTRVAVELLNLFDSRDNDITYFYASRLPGEPAEGVEDRHLHPVEPLSVRVSLRQSF